jgi:hypothetical protein
LSSLLGENAAPVLPAASTKTARSRILRGVGIDIQRVLPILRSSPLQSSAQVPQLVPKFIKREDKASGIFRNCGVCSLWSYHR